MTEVIELLPVKKVNPNDLTPFPGNPNTHPDDQIAELVASMHKNGWTRTAVVTGENVILAGHGAIEAAKLAGLKKINVSVAEGWSKDKQKAYVIIDNQLPLNAKRNDEALNQLLKELAESGETDMSELGMTEAELKRRIAAASNDSSGGDDKGQGVIIQYNIVFESEAQQETWYEFMRHVREGFSGDTFAESLTDWITHHLKAE